MKTVSLKDLPDEFAKLKNESTKNIIKYNSKDALVDGTSLTTNPVIQHRRKRIISKAGEIGCRTKVKEFISLCKWLSGKIDKPDEKPTKSHMMILSAIRNKKVISKSYECILKDYKNIVETAAKFTESAIMSKWYTLQKSVNVQTSKSIKDSCQKLSNLPANSKSITKLKKPKVTHKNHSKDATIFEQMMFEGYIEHLVNPSVIISKRDAKYYSALISILNGNNSSGYYRNYMSEIVNKHIDVLKEINFAKNRKVPKGMSWKKTKKILEDLLHNIDSKLKDNYYIKISEDGNKYLLIDSMGYTAAELDKDFKIFNKYTSNDFTENLSDTSIEYAQKDLEITDKIAEKIESKENIAAVTTQQTEDTIQKTAINDTLSLIMQLAKKSGVSEIIFKL